MISVSGEWVGKDIGLPCTYNSYIGICNTDLSDSTVNSDNPLKMTITCAPNNGLVLNLVTLNSGSKPFSRIERTFRRSIGNIEPGQTISRVIECNHKDERIERITTIASKVSDMVICQCIPIDESSDECECYNHGKEMSKVYANVECGN
jgi:hypothetical protein